MTDVSRSAVVTADEDRLPWLEPVDIDKADTGVGAGKLALSVIVALIAIGFIVGGLFWLRGPADEGQGDLIAAPATPYKVKPDAPGGMQVEGQGDTAYAASEGTETNARIDVSRLPEDPVEKTAPTVAEKPAAAPVEKPGSTKIALDDAAPAPVAAGKAAAPAAVATTAAPAAGGASIQLGAFSSEAKANAAWKAMSGRFTYLAPLAVAVQPATVGEKTIYRLRASGPDAKAVCAKLKAAGESCTTL